MYIVVVVVVVVVVVKVQNSGRIPGKTEYHISGLLTTYSNF